MAKEKYQLEYDMKSTPVSMLWSYIATDNGLKEWFADDAKMKGKEIVFDWNGTEQAVAIVGIRTDKYVRYHWKDDDDKSYFELKITTSEMSDNTVLTVTDFAEPDDMAEAKDLWNYQVEALQRLLGCW